MRCKGSGKAGGNLDDESEECEFWRSHDSADHLDWSKAERVRMPKLKPSIKSISIRLPVDMLEHLKLATNLRDLPYQSLIKIWLEEKLGA